MSAYYYVAASLPFLTGPEQTPPISSEDLLDICRRFMEDDDFADIAATNLDPEADSEGLTRIYRSWEKSLRNDLAKLRAVDQGLDSDKFVREYKPVFGTQSVAADAMSQSTPLEAELYLVGQRWSKIDELSTGHFFDMEFLRGYRLKLLLQERRSLFDEEKGFAAYRDLYQRVLEASGEKTE